MDRTKDISKWTMVTDFPAQQKVYIHLKTLRFWALFRMGRVSHFCWLWKNFLPENIHIYTNKINLFMLQTDTKTKRVRLLCLELLPFSLVRSKCEHTVYVYVSLSFYLSVFIFFCLSIALRCLFSTSLIPILKSVV